METFAIDMSPNSEPKLTEAKGDFRLEFNEVQGELSGGWHQEWLKKTYVVEPNTNGWHIIANNIGDRFSGKFADFCDSIEGRKTVKQVQELFTLFCKAHEIDPNQFQ